MKHAYVSLVLPVQTLPDAQVIERIDQALYMQTRAHEIVIVAPYGLSVSPLSSLTTRGPVSIVSTHIRSTPDASIIAGLGRTVGDFVIEWRGPLEAIHGQLIDDLLAPTDIGVELVEAIGVETSHASRLFGKAINGLRPGGAPVRRSLGRAYSRHALQALLDAFAFEAQLDVLVAELPVHRSRHPVGYPTPHHASMAQRISDGFALLAKGTRFGSAAPLALAAFSALLGFAVAIYALGFLLLARRTPEGWTTLMVVIGLGQAAVLTMLALTWTRIDSLVRGLSRSSEATAQVTVWPPSESDA